MLKGDTDVQIIEQMVAIMKEGVKSRDGSNDTRGKYQPGTIEHFLHMQGWLRRDLQLALCNADPRYGEEQLRFGNITQE